MNLHVCLCIFFSPLNFSSHWVIRKGNGTHWKRDIAHSPQNRVHDAPSDHDADDVRPAGRALGRTPAGQLGQSDSVGEGAGARRAGLPETAEHHAPARSSLAPARRWEDSPCAGQPAVRVSVPQEGRVGPSETPAPRRETREEPLRLQLEFLRAPLRKTPGEHPAAAARLSPPYAQPPAPARESLQTGTQSEPSLPPPRAQSKARFCSESPSFRLPATAFHRDVAL